MIERLGASDYEARQATQEALVPIGPEVVAALHAVADGKDPEQAPIHKAAKEALVKLKASASAATQPGNGRVPKSSRLRSPHVPARAERGMFPIGYRFEA